MGPSELQWLLDLQDVPGVIKLLDFYERADSFIYVMEKPENCMDLYDYIDEKKTIDKEVARNFFKQIVDVVAACHDRGIVHRDIKDENLLVDLSGSETGGTEGSPSLCGHWGSCCSTWWWGTCPSQ